MFMMHNQLEDYLKILLLLYITSFKKAVVNSMDFVKSRYANTGLITNGTTVNKLFCSIFLF